MDKYRATILVIDDDKDVLTSARLLLKQHFQKVIVLPNPREINAVLSEEEVDLVLLDMNFSRGDNDGREGIYWLKHIREIRPTMPVVLMTAYGEVDLAVRAIKQGAIDFVVKPWTNEKLLATLNAALQLAMSRKKIETLEHTQKTLVADKEAELEHFVGESPAMKKVFETIDKVGRTDANVLILGENGTGKTLVAQALHKVSVRSIQPFITVDLGALNENLFESELFGHKKGSFTDAREDKPGRFELANQGTIFLDEIGNLPMHLQAKLLTVLQSKKVMRVGETREKVVDVRLITATNMPLYEMVSRSEFRQDLLYRINTVEIHLPPLRERVEDIPILAGHFMKRFAKKYNKPYLRLTSRAVNTLQDYNWPGNIRELEHTIERTAILAEGEVIDESQLQINTSLPQHEEDDMSVNTLNLEDMERHLIEKAIRKHKGNISKAASDLGLTRAALYRRMEKYGI
ncbi:MAG: sigma-54 dependent transcriptional regulator [Bacteroidota bacterium]|nr:sigma-54 dependent transcriptional regulator [Bacteroidota bacterium]